MPPLFPLFPLAAAAAAPAELPPVDGPVAAAEEAADGTVWVLLEGGRLLAFRRTAEGPWTPAGERDVPGAVGLFSAGGAVWVETRGAVPLAAAPAGARAAEAPPAGEPAPAIARRVSVAEVRSGMALLGAGPEAGLAPGTSVRFLARRRVRTRADAVFGGEAETEVVEATGRVVAVRGARAVVELDRGGRVAAGDVAEAAPRPGVVAIAPERLGGIGEVGLAVRPVLALDTIGLALVDEAWAWWAFEGPWYVEGRVSPFGVGWSRDGNVLSLAATASGGFDHRAFSVGLGAGWSMLNGEVGRSFGAGSADTSVEDVVDAATTFEGVDHSFALVQEARLGARDGLNLTVRNLFLLVPATTWEDCGDGTGALCEVRDGSEFRFGGITMRVAVPVGARFDLVADWGTGEAGARWFEAGVATWLRGNGDRGSLAAEVTAGFGGLEGRPDEEWIDLAGPMVGGAVRWRL